jgi:hypothetical protein
MERRPFRGGAVISTHLLKKLPLPMDRYGFLRSRPLNPIIGHKKSLYIFQVRGPV